MGSYIRRLLCCKQNLFGSRTYVVNEKDNNEDSGFNDLVPQNVHISMFSNNLGRREQFATKCISYNSYNVHYSDNRRTDNRHTDNRHIENVVNQPRANAIQIGNDSHVHTVSHGATSVDFEREGNEYKNARLEKRVDVLEKEQTEQKSQFEELIKEQTKQKFQCEEILELMKRMSFSDTESTVGVLDEDRHELGLKSRYYADSDEPIIGGASLVSERQETFNIKTDGTHGVLQNLRWYQYMREQQLQREFKSRLQACSTIQEVDKVVEQFIRTFPEDISNYTTRLGQEYAKSTSLKANKDTNWVENAQQCLKDREERVVKIAKENIQVFRSDSYKRIQKASDKVPRVEWGSEQITGEEAAEKFIDTLTKIIQQHVESLLTFDIEHFIVVESFKCQKSYVIREIMKECTIKEFPNSMNYIMKPNEFATQWLREFTDDIVFYKDKKSGQHRYAKMSIRHTDSAVREIKVAFEKANDSTNYNTWKAIFLEQLNTSKCLPISENDVNGIFKNGTNPCKSKFIAIVAHRLENLSADILNYFRHVDERTVRWDPDVHVNIFEKLWGCGACCPFCNEPCRYTDVDHIKEGFKHDCLQHRPLGVTGFLVNKDLTLDIDYCNMKVQEHDKWYQFKKQDGKQMFIDYKDTYPEWNIDIRLSEIPKYWVWFLRKNSRHFSKLYGALCPEYPDSWKNISAEEAVKSLESVYSCC